MVKEVPAEVWSKKTGPVPVSPAVLPAEAPGPAEPPEAAPAGGGTYRGAAGPAWRLRKRGGSSTSPSAGVGLLVPGTQAEPPQ